MCFRRSLRGPTHVVSSLPALLFLAATACSTARAQTTIHVPQDQPTIQAAITAANNGDTVLVSPGTYSVNLDFNGKAITVTTGATSYTDAAVAATILTPADPTLAIVDFQSGEGQGSVLNGFTLTAGTTIPDPNGPPFTNQDFGYEASVYGAPNSSDVFTASPTITNNRFVQGLNGVQLAAGEISGNYFTGFVNTMIFDGGHVHDNIFENNPNAGNGIIQFDGLFERNLIRNNSVIPADNYPGSIDALVLISGGVFLQNLVYGNYSQYILYLAAPGSGPVTTIVAENTFANNTVSINAAPSYPTPCSGAACFPQPSAQVFFTTTQATPYSGNQALFVNNIFAVNSPGPAIICPQDQPDTNPPATDTLQFDHNLFSASSGPIFDPTCRQQIMTSGNTMADPLFVNPSTSDFHLSKGSPAIDTGNNSLLAELSLFSVSLTADYDNNPRPVDATTLGYPVLDRGAYEFAGTTDAQPTSLLLTPSRYTPLASQTVTLTAALSSSLGAPQGTITLLRDGTQIASAPALADGTAQFTLTGPNPSGIHEFEADYPGANPFPPATSLKLVLNFAISQTELNIIATPQTGPPGTAVLLTVYAISDDGSIPSPITLTDNGTPLATLTPGANGQATLNVTNFTPGTHKIVATYAGNAAESPSTASVVVTINDFTIAVQPPSITIVSGQQGAASVILTSLGTFADTLTLTAPATPQYVTFSFTPASVPLSAGTTYYSALTINTGSLQTAHAEHTRLPLIFAALIILPLALKRRRLLRYTLPAFLATLLLTASTGCTGLSIPLQHVTPGTYVIPITATDPATGISHSANLTLIVTPYVSNNHR